MINHLSLNINHKKAFFEILVYKFFLLITEKDSVPLLRLIII